MSQYGYGLNEVLEVRLDKCCDSPNVVFGRLGGIREDYIKCTHCNFEVFGYIIKEMFALWNELIAKRVKVSNEDAKYSQAYLLHRGT